MNTLDILERVLVLVIFQFDDMSDHNLTEIWKDLMKNMERNQAQKGVFLTGSNWHQLE